LRTPKHDATPTKEGESTEFKDKSEAQIAFCQARECCLLAFLFPRSAAFAIACQKSESKKPLQNFLSNG
jgi:hypothetical protein